MTNASVFPVPPDFNPHAWRDLDPQFAEAFDLWRFASKEGGFGEEVAWRDMMACGIQSSGAMLAKLIALRTKLADAIDQTVHGEFTVRDILEFDAERLAKREMLAA